MKQLNYCHGWFLAVAMTPCGAATIQVDILPGASPPPAMLGTYQMLGFPAEMRPEFDMVVDAAAPDSGVLQFGNPLELNYVPGGWATWSHGYSGAVYTTFDSSLSLSFPAGTQAFYLYLQPNLKDVFEFTLDAQGTTTTLNIDGDGGARYIGFYADDPSLNLSGLTITENSGLSDGFAVGEFGINVIPEPGSLLGLGCVLASGLLLRHRRQI